MKISTWLLTKPLTGCLVILLAAPFGSAAPAQQQPSPVPQASNTTPSQPQSPDAKSAATNTAPSASTRSDPQAPAPVQNSAPVQNDDQSGSSSVTQPAQDQQKNSSTRPLGAAAAPSENGMGVTASRPAGAVIAPAKQRRVRIFLIRVAIVVGAGVAIGTVMALSHASPSSSH